MSYESPVSILFSSDGYESSVTVGSAIPAGTRGYLHAGSDGTNARILTVDTSGRTVVIGSGSAGSAATGVLTIQGIASMTPVQVSQATAANLNATVVQGTAAANSGAWTVKLTDGSNNPSLLNSSPAGTEYGLVVRPIPSGTQTISGTVNQGTAAAVANGWYVRLSDGTNATILLNSTPAGTEYALVTRNIPSGTQTISGTVTANAGTGNFNVVGTGTAGSAASGVVTVQGIAGGTAVPVSGTITVTKSSTATASSVAGSATSVALLASNANRLFATIYNDSNAILYLQCGATASVTSFMIKLYPNTFYELSINYTGAINGIWSNANGNARIVEFT